LRPVELGFREGDSLVSSPGEPTRGRGLGPRASAPSFLGDCAWLVLHFLCRWFCLAFVSRRKWEGLPRKPAPVDQGKGRRPALGTGLPSVIPLHDPLRQVEDIFRSKEVELRGCLLLHHLVERLQRVRLTDPLEESLPLVKVRMDREEEMG